MGEETHHEVREILDSRWHHGKQYLVEWKHFSKGEREWVKKEHLCASKLVKRYHAMFPDKPFELPPQRVRCEVLIKGGKISGPLFRFPVMNGS